MRIIRVGIPSMDDRGLDSSVSEHFGRTPFYTFIDVTDYGKILNVDVQPVPFEEHGPGDLPYWLKQQGVEIVLAQGIGGKAVDFFEQLGIQVIRGVTGRIEDVIKGYLAGTLVTVEWEGGKHKEGHERSQGGCHGEGHDRGHRHHY